jgi:hypothetical protein
MGEAEQRTAGAVEQLVHSNAFGEILARATQNVMGLTKIGFDVLDLTVRNLRLAGRPDVARLGAQLARTEDKLERVLQEVERLQAAVATDRGGGAKNSVNNGGTSGNGRSGRSRATNSGSRSSKSRSTNGRSRAGAKKS